MFGRFEKLRYVLVFILFINFMISGVFINLCQLVIWLCIRPFSLKLYRKLNYYCLYTLWIQILFVAEWWSSSACYVYTDEKTWEKMGSEHAIVIMNHNHEVDWLMGWLVCEQSRLMASSKVFMKKAIKWVPVVGWAWQFAEIVFLERNWEKDKENMTNQVGNLRDYPDHVWLLLFAEGTRFTPSKHAASVEFAKKSNLPPLKHLLLPRTKGFLATVEKLRGHFPAIYCATLGFNKIEGAEPSLKNMLLGRRVLGEMLLERIPLDSIPHNPDEAAEWLHKNYRHKDNMLDHYHKEGFFPMTITGEGHYFTGPIKRRYRSPRLYGICIMSATAYITLPPVFYGLISLISSGISNTFIAVFLLFAGLNKLVGLTRISKASNYGKAAEISSATASQVPSSG